MSLGILQTGKYEKVPSLRSTKKAPPKKPAATPIGVPTVAPGSPQAPLPPGPASVSQVDIDKILAEYDKLYTAQENALKAQSAVAQQKLANAKQLIQARLASGRTDIEELEREGVENVTGEALQRGIFDSGIKQADITQVHERAARGIGELEFESSIQLQDIDLAMQEIGLQLGIDMAGFRQKYLSEGLTLTQGLLKDYGAAAPTSAYNASSLKTWSGPNAAGSFNRIAFAGTSAAKTEIG